MNYNKLGGVILLGLFGTACTHEVPKAPETSNLTGIPIELMDQKVDPCQDFWHHANGSWIAENPVPNTESSWSSFSELSETNRSILRKILEDAQNNTIAEKGSNTQKLGDFYATAMDSARLDAEGINPLLGRLELINALQSKEELLPYIAQHHRQGIGSLFSMSVGADARNSTEYIVYLGQGGLSLPDRDYYFRTDPKSAEIREQFITHVKRMFTLMDFDEETAAIASEKVIGFESALADASMDRVTRRDVEKTTQKFSYSDFEEQHALLGLNNYFTNVGIPLQDSIIVAQPLFFDRLVKMLDQESLDTWKIYLRWKLIDASASLLSSDLEKANFDFFSTTLRGTKEMQPRWKRALGAVNSSLGEMLGQEFVKETFTPETKAKAEQMVDNLILSLRERLALLDWMGEETKVQAKAKIDKLKVKIGYPNVWKDWSKLELDRSSYLQNTMRCNEVAFERMIDKLGKPIDREEWLMIPQRVNAYYHPLLNEIVFPAAILQAPFYDPNADDALNYGGIGAVIGHELSHGYDDQGNKFDAEGNINNWWTTEDSSNFASRAAGIVEQFNGYKAADSLYVNGGLTLGENIADLGGLKIAYYAYQKSLEGKERKEIDGLSPEQRFFLSWAQVWKTNYTPESLEIQVKTNSHSPAMFRVSGPMENLPEFHEAFGCEMTPEQKEKVINIW